MSNKTRLFPFNGHRTRARSLESFIDIKKVFPRLKLKRNDVFMDAGCGDGHVSILAQKMLEDDAVAYARHSYQPSIEDLEKDVQRRGIINIVPIQRI